jgi:hypothetical protein
LARFIADFDRTKQKLMDVCEKAQNTESRTNQLEITVNSLHNENVKLKTEMGILREEHTEVLHNLFNLERRNQVLD